MITVMEEGGKKSVNHDLTSLITQKIVIKVGDSGKISQQKETALMGLLVRQQKRT